MTSQPRATSADRLPDPRADGPHPARTLPPQQNQRSTSPNGPLTEIGLKDQGLKGRLDLARQLYDTGKVRAILVSGDNGTHRYDEPDAMRRYLIAAGVPQRQVVADYAGFDTYASCRRADRVFGVRAVIVVTQTYHLPRAVTTCRALGLDASGVGDESVRVDAEVWRNGQVRELAANQKLVLELLRHREPLSGPHETGIDEALH